MKKYVLIGIVFILVLISIATTTVHNSSTQQEGKPLQNQEIAANPTEALKYKILDKNENKVVENIFVLVEPGETNGEKIALEIKKTCKNKCNIDLFDDQKAFDLQKQYTEMLGKPETKPSDATEWKNTNYVFVAEHLIGSIDFETGTYKAFPMKDWHYEELKQQKK